MPKCILSGQVKSIFTQEQADDRYLKLSGRTMNGTILAPNQHDFGISISSASIQIGNGGPAFAVSPSNEVTVDSEPMTEKGVANKAYVDSKRPIGRTVTLSSSAWLSNSQTATVQGVNANGTGQIIDWGAHDQTSYTALASAQLFVSASSSANQLVFTALGEVPSSNVSIDIRIQEGQGV